MNFRSRITTFAAVGAALPLTALLLAGCGGGTQADQAAPASPSPAGASGQTQQAGEAAAGSASTSATQPPAGSASGIPDGVQRREALPAPGDAAPAEPGKQGGGKQAGGKQSGGGHDAVAQPGLQRPKPKVKMPGSGGACGKLHGAGTKYLQGKLYVTSGKISCPAANEIFNGYLTKPDRWDGGSGHFGSYKGYECGRDNNPTAKVMGSCDKDGVTIEVRR